METSSRRRFGFGVDFLAGGTALTISKTISAPFTRTQLLIATDPNEVWTVRYRLKMMWRVLDDQGFKALFRGNSVNVFRAFPTEAINFGLKDTIKSYFPSYNQINAGNLTAQVAINFINGGVCGVVTNLLTSFIYFPNIMRDLGQKPLSWSRRNLPFLPSAFVYRSTLFGLHDTIKVYNQYQNQWWSVPGVISKLCAGIVTSYSAIAATLPVGLVHSELNSRMRSRDRPDHATYKNVPIRKVLGVENLSRAYKSAHGTMFGRCAQLTMLLFVYDAINSSFYV